MSKLNSSCRALFRLVMIGVSIILILSSTAQAGPTLDPATQPKFQNEVPNPLSPGFFYSPTTPGGSHYEVGVYPTEQWLGLVDPDSGEPLITKLFGYGTGPGFPNATFPGRSFEVQRDQQITVHWTNNLVDSQTNLPLPHLLPVDETVHWAYSLPGYDLASLEYDGVPIVPHVHGGHSESDSDGLPEYWFTPGFALKGPRWVKETYVYDNDQQAGTIWYHDHGLGITRLNVYAGLAGFFIIRDDRDTGRVDNPLGLPVYPYESALAIQDRLFTEDGALFYPTTGPELPEGAPSPSALPEFFGDHILVNGIAWPKMSVEPRLYRLRLLNGSDSRFYDLSLTVQATDALGMGPKWVVIGNDNGLLYEPVVLDRLLIGPGERYDVLVDFGEQAGRTLVIRNVARSPFPKGDAVDPNATGQIMAFEVANSAGDLSNNTIPTTLRDAPIHPSDIGSAVRTRKLALFEGTDGYGRLQPMLGTAEPVTAVDGSTQNGAMLWGECTSPITENPMVDDVEIWEIYNATADAHPVHLHLVSFQILGRQKFKALMSPKELLAHDGNTSIGFTLENVRVIGQPRRPAAYEAGWKDTAIMYPGETTRLIAKFDRPGRYVWHCHILSHEDHEMMRAYYVGPFTPHPIMNDCEHAEHSVPGDELVSTPIPQLELAASPNPFNPSAVLRFALPQASHVRLAIYDLRGELVTVLENADRPAGNYELRWDGRDRQGASVASGTYFARLQTEFANSALKLVLTK